MSNGQKIISLYFLLFYIVPITTNSIWPDDIFTPFAVYPLSTMAIFQLCATFALFLLLSFSNFRLLPRINSQTFFNLLHSFGQFYLKYRILFALGYLTIGLFFFFSGLNRFRYTHQGISQGNSLILMVSILCNLFILLDFIYFIFVQKHQSIKLLSQRWFENILLAIVLILIASGSLSMMLSMTFLFYSCFPRYFFALLTAGNFLRQPIKSLSMVSLVIGIFLLGWIIGEMIKSSELGQTIDFNLWVKVIEYAFDKDSAFYSFIFYVMGRISVSYYSFLYTASDAFQHIEPKMLTYLQLPVENLLFRLNFITGNIFDVSKPEVSSIMRLNYINLTTFEITERQGSSPGLLGSFNYIFIFPLNIVASALYLNFVKGTIDRLLINSAVKKLSLFGLMFLLMLLTLFFESPFDLICFVNGGFFYVLILWFIATHQYQEHSRNRENHQALNHKDLEDERLQLT